MIENRSSTANRCRAEHPFGCSIQEVHGLNTISGPRPSSQSPAAHSVQLVLSSIAMTFVRSQRKHQSLQTARLWAADRRRLKVVSKLKKYLIELGSYSPKNVVASYKSCKVVVRDNAKLLPIANINEDLSVNWLHNGIELQPVQVALEEFIADMELAGRMVHVLAYYFPTCWDSSEAAEELYDITSLLL